MSIYEVGINKQEIIEAEDEDDTIAIFMKNLSWKDCWTREIQTEGEEE